MVDRNVYAVYEFGPFRVDTLTRQLMREGMPVQLTSKAFNTLTVLLERQGETIAKAELMNSVWGEIAVEENNLTQQISTLRRVLGEGARDHKFIVTVPGRGYCFVALVKKKDGSRARVVSESESIHHKTRPSLYSNSSDSSSAFGIFLAIAYVIAICLPVLILGGDSLMVRSQSIAVLAFKTAGSGEEPLGIGIRDTLRAKLGSVDDITVRHGSSEQERPDVIDAGRQLNVDIVLTGSIQRDEDRVRVAVEMVDVTNERIVWGKTFDDSFSNVFELQDSIAAEVVRVLQRQRTSSKNNVRLVAEGFIQVASSGFHLPAPRTHNFAIVSC